MAYRQPDHCGRFWAWWWPSILAWCPAALRDRLHRPRCYRFLHWNGTRFEPPLTDEDTTSPALLNEHAIPDGDVRRVPRSLTQQEIANRIGASREMVNHVVRELIQGDYIHKDAGHRMTLLKALPTEAESHRRRYLQQAGPK